MAGAKCCVFFILSFALLVTATCVGAVRKPNKIPVILVPGDGGSQLYAKLNKTKTVKWFCQKRTRDYYQLWLSISQIAPGFIHCFVDNIRLQYHSSLKKTSNSPGVSIKVPGFGVVDYIEWLSEGLQISKTEYFRSIVKELVTKHGYERNLNILGAPFDFRKAPNEQSEYYNNLKTLIEASYKSAGNRRVLLVAHSLGCLYTLTFLQRQSSAWKAQYIHAFMALSGPFGGSAMTIQALGSGDTLGIPLVNPLNVRPSQRSWPSTYYMLPNEAVWPRTQVLAMTKQRNYTASDYKAYMKTLNYPKGLELLQFTRNITNPLKAPGVPVHCVSGINVSTSTAFDWRQRSTFEQQPRIINGNGDGTVNAISLQVCTQWKSLQSQTVNHLEVNGVSHVDILSDKKMLQYLSKLVTEN